MKRFAMIAGCAVMLAALATVAVVQAQDMPDLPPPQEEHEWLQRFVGEWTTSAEAIPMPGAEPIECQGSAKVKSLGGWWVISEQEANMMGMNTSAVLTIGYDASDEQFVGTWIDSMTDYMWHYEGELDEEKQTLTLLTRGPNMHTPGEMADFREVLTFKNDDHIVFTSAVKSPDGEWFEFITMHYRRVK